MPDMMMCSFKHNGVYAMNKKSLGLGLTLAALLLAIAVLPQPAARAVTDTTPPTGTIVINDNKSCTNSRNVTIAMTWADNAGGSGVARWTARSRRTSSRSSAETLSFRTGSTVAS